MKWLGCPAFIGSPPRTRPFGFEFPAPGEATPGLDGAAKRVRPASLACRHSVATGGSRGKRKRRDAPTSPAQDASPEAALDLLRLIREATKEE